MRFGFAIGQVSRSRSNWCPVSIDWCHDGVRVWIPRGLLVGVGSIPLSMRGVGYQSPGPFEADAFAAIRVSRFSTIVSRSTAVGTGPDRTAITSVTVRCLPAIQPLTLPIIEGPQVGTMPHQRDPSILPCLQNTDPAPFGARICYSAETCNRRSRPTRTVERAAPVSIRFQAVNDFMRAVLSLNRPPPPFV